mmetsp:Transcript_36603/g.72923  ORF Transcript_36603/g.72923 Transcript_36603/m.72923 type:complete len:207 (+) Transcript_36603:206-826(+)
MGRALAAHTTESGPTSLGLCGLAGPNKVIRKGKGCPAVLLSARHAGDPSSCDPTPGMPPERPPPRGHSEERGQRGEGRHSTGEGRRTRCWTYLARPLDAAPSATRALAGRCGPDRPSLLTPRAYAAHLQKSTVTLTLHLSPSTSPPNGTPAEVPRRLPAPLSSLTLQPLILQPHPLVGSHSSESHSTFHSGAPPSSHTLRWVGARE